MTNKLIIDNREQQIKKLLIDKGIDFEIEQLKCGDILLQKDSNCICIERKTIQDLWSSIKDGRFREQRARLMDWRNECPLQNHVMYVIEGVPEDEILVSAIHRLTLIYKIPVWIKNNMEETIDYIIWIRDNKTLFNERTQENDKIENLAKSMKCKKDFQTSQNILVALIQSFNGFSYEMAKSVTASCHSIKEFIEFCERDGVQQVKEITYETKSKAIRKIGLEKGKKIFILLGIPFDTKK
jgi:ERCC4-type nuclease